MPRAWSLRTSAKSSRVSPAESELVGSSITMMRAPVPTAAAICTSCSRPVESVPMMVSGSMSAWMLANISRARARSAARSTQPARRGMSPRHRFSATVMFGQNASSWCTIAMPSRRASSGEAGATPRPSSRTSPPSAV